MNKVVLVSVVIVSLGVGGVIGFFVGVASTKAGQAFIRELVEDEQKAEVSQPRRLSRERFELQYPSNWSIDEQDEDYDPDHLFTIESPGSAFVMFALGAGDTTPEGLLQIQVRQFEKLMSRPEIQPFDQYGGLPGKGAILKGSVMGIRTTTTLFAANQNGATVLITQQCPDEDLKQVQDGLQLIEKTFRLTDTKPMTPPDTPDAGDRN